MARLRQIIPDGIDEHIVADGLGGADPQPRPLLFRDGQPQLLELLLPGDGIPLQKQAFFRLVQVVAVVIKQLRLQRLLQGLDLLGDSRLGQMQPLGCQTVIHGLTKGQKGVQLGIHIHPPITNRN